MMATSHNETCRLERMKKELEANTQQLVEERKKYQEQLKELRAEQIKVAAQKHELESRLKQQSNASNPRNRAQTICTPAVEHKLRQEIKELKSDSQLTARRLTRTCSDLDAANQHIKALKKGLMKQEHAHSQTTKNTLNQRTQILLKVIEALRNEQSAVLLDEIIQNTDQNEDDEQWKKALKELSKMDNGSSEFMLCNELLNEMVLRQHDLESLRQVFGSTDPDTHDMDEMYHSIQRRHVHTMQNIQRKRYNAKDEGKTRVLFNNIETNNQKWLSDVQQFMIKLRNKDGATIEYSNPTQNIQETKQYVIEVEDIDQDLKSRLDRKRKQTVNNELEAIFTEILLNEGRDEGWTSSMNHAPEQKTVSVDAMEGKYNCKCIEYEELEAQYSKLKEEYALQAMFENEYKKLLYELMNYKKLNEKQQEEHQQKCAEYEEECKRLVSKYDKANKRAEQLQTMYQMEYEKVLQELMEYRHKQEESESKYNKMKNEYRVLSNLMDATKEENGYLMQQLAASKRVQREYNELQTKYKAKCKECEDQMQDLSESQTKYDAAQKQLEATANECRRVKDKMVGYTRLESECNSLKLQYSTMETEYKRKHREQLNCKRDLNKITKEYETLSIEMEEYKKTKRQLTEYNNNLQSKYRAMKSDYEERKKDLNEMRDKHAKLEHEYGALYTELNQTQSNQKHRIQQLEALYETEYTNLLKEFDDYKNSSEEPHNQQHIEELKKVKKQNKFMKQNQDQIQKIYEAEYEKLLKEFMRYKQAHPPNTTN